MSLVISVPNSPSNIEATALLVMKYVTLNDAAGTTTLRRHRSAGS
jgi:hypothetical protein